MLQRSSAWSLLCFTTLSSASPPGQAALPDHAQHLLDDDDWGVLKYGFQHGIDEDDEEDQQVDAPLDAQKEALLDDRIEYLLHDGMVSDEALQAHHSIDAYNQRKAARKALEEEQVLDTKISEGLTAEQKDKAGITTDEISAEEMEELITLMGHFKEMNVLLYKGRSHKVEEDHRPSANVDMPEANVLGQDELRMASHRSRVSGPPAAPKDNAQVSGQFSMGRHSGKEDIQEDEAELQQAPEVSHGFKMGLKPGKSGIVRGAADIGESVNDADGGYVDHAKARTTTTTMLPEVNNVVRGAGQNRVEQNAIAELNAAEPAKEVASTNELQSMKEELKDHPKVLKALQAGISSGVVQGMNSSFSWEIVARTAEWAAESSMQSATSKSKKALLGAVRSEAALHSLKSIGSIKSRVEKMMDKELRRNSKSQEHRSDADQIVQETTGWITEQIVAKQILNITDIDLGMIMKAMVLGTSRAISRCSSCRDTAKATAVAAADIAMQDVADRIEKAKELQQSSKDSRELQASMFAMIWGRSRAAQMGIAEHEIDWDEVAALINEKTEEVRKTNSDGNSTNGKKDPYKAAKMVVKEYLKKHAQKALNAFKLLAKESAQQVKDETKDETQL